MPGMTANLDIVTEQVENAMLVPVAALNFKPSGMEQVNWQNTPQGALNDYEVKGTIWMLDQEELKPVRVGVLLNNGRWVAIDTPVIQPGTELVIGEIEKKSRSKKEEEAQSPFMPSLPGNNKNQAS